MNRSLAAPAEVTGPTGRRAPLFRLDPGWMFVLAGLTVCASGVILPAQADLHALRQQLDELRGEETRWYARLKAHADFVDQVDRGEEDLIRRLAASQLNMIPATETPVLLSPSNAAPVTQWIDATVQVDEAPVKPLPVSALARLANGPDRLWLFAGGIMCVFVGLLLGPGLVRRTQVKSANASSSNDLKNDVEAINVLNAGLVRDQVADRIDRCQGDSTRDPDDDATDGELLTAEHVHSRVLVEVPPSARTMEVKVVAPSEKPPHANRMETPDAAAPSTPASGRDDHQSTTSCLIIANDAEAADMATTLTGQPLGGEGNEHAHGEEGAPPVDAVADGDEDEDERRSEESITGGDNGAHRSITPRVRTAVNRFRKWDNRA